MIVSKKAKLRLLYAGMALLGVYFLFSLFEIYNISALYKDQVEMAASLIPDTVTIKYTFFLIDNASRLTSFINFFQYSAFTSPILMIWLALQAKKSRKN